MPGDPYIRFIYKLDGTNFLLSLCERNIVALSLESTKEPSVVSYAFPHTSFQAALSADHLFCMWRVVITTTML